MRLTTRPEVRKRRPSGTTTAAAAIAISPKPQIRSVGENEGKTEASNVLKKRRGRRNLIKS